MNSFYHFASFSIDQNVIRELHKIMFPSVPCVCYNYQSRTKSLFESMPIPRQPKRIGKLLLASKNYCSMKKKHVSTSTFQKMIVAFQHMGPEAPKKFTCSEKLICVRGLLPAISVDAPETEVRKEICDVLSSNADLAEVTPDDFEFINTSGKQASITQCKSGFKWDGDAVKELAGSGSVYVRLLCEFDLAKQDTSSELSNVESPCPRFLPPLPPLHKSIK